MLVSLTCIMLNFATLYNRAHALPAGEDAGQASRGARFTAVALACKVEYPRLCPGYEAGRVGGRDQYMCLKFFKPDLSLGCRRAITAAKP
jgi:hypothetical protein